MTKYIIVLSVLLLTVAEFARATDDDAAADKLEQGKQLAFERRKGNCLACHIIAGGELAGNLGPPLVLMTARFPDRAKLRAQIWDARCHLLVDTEC